MYSFFVNIAAPTVWVVSAIELLLFIYLIYKSIKTRSLLLGIITMITFGLFYDAFITSLGTVIDASNIMILSQMRFVLHSALVPYLFFISVGSIKPKKAILISMWITTFVLIIIGLISICFTKYVVIDLAGISRLTINKEETNRIFTKIPTVINIISIIPLIAVGIYVLIKEKNVYLLLSGGLMLLFSAIGPMLKLTDFIFLLSMFGEIFMVIFLILYFMKKDKKNDA